MSNPPVIPATPISITTPDSDSETKLRRTINDVVGAQAIEYTNRILRYFLVAVVGAIAAIIWNLNGLIYQAVGETSVSTKALEMEIARLKDEVTKLEKEARIKNCLEDKKVTDKAGCYRGY